MADRFGVPASIWSAVKRQAKEATHQKTVSGLETGQTQRIEFDLLQRLADALRCKPKDLIGEGK